jgi:ribulose-phosphate 3-epimerase
MMASPPVQIVPSVLPADFSRLGEDIAALEKAGVDRIQWDVMDGHFVPNLTIGPVVVRSLRKATSLPLECHLMIEDPDTYAPEFAAAGADTITVHPEGARHLHRTIHRIRDLGKRVGVALNPATSEDAIAEIIADVDLVLVMTVNPGFGGQKFIEGTLPKIRRLRELIDSVNPASRRLRGSARPGRGLRGLRCERRRQCGVSPDSRCRRPGVGASLQVIPAAPQESHARRNFHDLRLLSLMSEIDTENS